MTIPNRKTWYYVHGDVSIQINGSIDRKSAWYCYPDPEFPGMCLYAMNKADMGEKILSHFRMRARSKAATSSSSSDPSASPSASPTEVHKRIRVGCVSTNVATNVATTQEDNNE